MAKITQPLTRRITMPLTIPLNSAVGLGAGTPQPVAPTAPVLSVYQVVGDGVQLDSYIDETIGSGDFVQTQVTSTADTLWASPEKDITSPITSGEDSSNIINEGLTGLSAGNKKARQRVAKAITPTLWSNWSNEPTFTIAAASNAVIRTDNSYSLRTDGSRIVRAA